MPKITDFPTETNLDSSELIPIVKAGGNRKVDLSAIFDWMTSSRSLVRYLGGSFIFNGEEVSGLSSYTFEEMTDPSFDLTRTRTVFCSNRHSTRDATSTPGSVWRVVPTAVGNRKLRLLSDPIYFALLSSAPDPTAWPGLRIFAANVGISGSELTANGTVYRPDATHITLVNNLDLISRAKSASPDINVEWQPLAVRLPRDVNNKSIFQNGDYLSIWNAWAEKTGVTDSLTVSLRFGTLNTTSDTQLLSSPASSTGANVERIIRFAEIQRVDKTHLRWRGLQSTVFQNGPLSTTRANDIPVADMDSTLDSYLNIGIYISALNDSAIGLREYEVRLVRGV